MSHTILNAASAGCSRAAQGTGLGSALAARAWALGRGLLRAGRRHAPSAAEEAAEVREMARRIQFSEPGFASDLLAAADRHERLAERAR